MHSSNPSSPTYHVNPSSPWILSNLQFEAVPAENSDFPGDVWPPTWNSSGTTGQTMMFTSQAMHSSDLDLQMSSNVNHTVDDKSRVMGTKVEGDDDQEEDEDVEVDKSRGKRKRSSRGKKASNALEVSESVKQKRKKHNEVEIRRRKRISDGFDKLQSLTNCTVSQRGDILECAVGRIQELEAELSRRKDTKKCAGTCSSDTKHSSNGATKGNGADSGKPLVPLSSTLSYSDLFTSSGAPMMLNTVNGQIVDCNDAFCKMMRAPKSQLVASGKGLFAFTHEDSLASTFDMISKLISEEITSADIVKSFLTQTGEVFQARATVWIVREGGKPMYVNCVVVPLTSKHGSFNAFEDKPKKNHDS